MTKSNVSFQFWSEIQDGCKMLPSKPMGLYLSWEHENLITSHFEDCNKKYMYSSEEYMSERNMQVF